MSGSFDASGGFVSSEGEPTTRDAIFRVLTDEERCAAIKYLSQKTGAVPVDELVGFVDATSVSQEGVDSRQRRKIQFHHCHLPKMDAAGLIDYDHDDRTVTPTETLDAAHQLLDQETDTQTQ